MNRAWFCLLLLILIGAAEPTYTPTSDYETRTLEGFTLRINRTLLKDHPDLADRTLALLKVKLFDVKRVVPAPALKHLLQVPIWIEYKDKQFPCMCYHPSAGWLKNNGYNPEKAGGVEIANAENFLKWTIDQPWMILHELAHAYHHRVFGYNDPDIKSAYDNAVARKNYEQVLHIAGRKTRHYALNNPMEYFAEGTEAFFGTNDFYPFVRAELKQHDPDLYTLLHRLWNTPPEKPRQN